MSFKKGCKLIAACIIMLGFGIGDAIISERIGNIVGDKLADWVDS